MKTAKSGAERRIHERINIELRLDAFHGDRAGAAVTEDVSVGGARLQSMQMDSDFEVGDQFVVSFCLPSMDKPVCLGAEIRWVGSTKQSCGIRFGPKSRRIMAGLLSATWGPEAGPCSSMSAARGAQRPPELAA